MNLLSNKPVAIFADLHLGIKQDSSEWHTITLEWCDWFVEQLKSREIDTIFFLGDFFHNKFVISSTTLYAASLFFSKLKDFQIHIIFGNHDLYYLNNPEVASVNIFTGYTNVHIYTKPTELEYNGKKIVFCGWGYDPLEYSGDLLLTHAEIDVFQYNNFMQCQSDLKPSELLKHYNHVISGHFHKQQYVKYDDGKVIEYIGNPFQMDFSDERTDKVFGILNPDDLSLDYVKNPISPTFYRYKLSELVKFKKIDKFTDSIHNSYIKILMDRNITILDANELKTTLLLFRPRDLKLEWLESEDISVVEENIKGFKLVDVINEYLDNIDVENKEEIKKYIISLYETCSNK